MASSEYAGRRNSNTQILQELEALSESLYQPQAAPTRARRTASLALPRTAVPPISSADEIEKNDAKALVNPKPRARRMSLSPWRSRPKEEENDEPARADSSTSVTDGKNKLLVSEPPSSEKKGIWNWKPIRAITHITMQKLSCLFSVEVVTVQGLPASMNGLRLAVSVRKKENKDGAVQTMPSRVSEGSADFEETLFIRCHVYFTPGSGTQMKFEPRPFLIQVVAVDAAELDFGKSTVDLSALIQESIEKSFEGARVRQWDTSFVLSGKAKGGELVLKLGFQIMEKDGGIGIYSQAEGQRSGKGKSFSPSVARKQSKTSFSVPSPRITSRAEAWTPSQKGGDDSDRLRGIDDLNLDEPAPPAMPKSEEVEKNIDDTDFPMFDVVDKGVEIQEKDGGGDEKEVEEELSEENSDYKSVSSEVVKEVVQDQTHLVRLTELDSIAQQIKALEAMMKDEDKPAKDDDETGSQVLDAEEDKVTREFLQMLEGNEDDGNIMKDTNAEVITGKQQNEKDPEEDDSEVFLSDLGKGLGCIIQTRNGGYLAAMNPLDTVVERKDSPKLAMQLSKPMVLRSDSKGFEIFQKLASIGVDELTSEVHSLMPMEELKGKTAEQIAFEGIANAIIQGRNKEGASSSAARTIAAVKYMASALSTGRKERASTGIWNASEDPVTIDEILGFSMQKIESMSLDALKIQADMAEEEDLAAPFDVSPLGDANAHKQILTSAIPIEDCIDRNNDSVTVAVVVQLRDPLRQFEAVGAPMIALIHAVSEGDSEEKRYKVSSLQVGGLKLGNNNSSAGSKLSVWDSEKRRLTALQWLLEHGIGKAASSGKKGKRLASKGDRRNDLLWSISSRIMADMWLKAIRNPDVKFTTK